VCTVEWVDVGTINRFNGKVRKIFNHTVRKIGTNPARLEILTICQEKSVTVLALVRKVQGYERNGEPKILYTILYYILYKIKKQKF
jgi:hypothetical protein